MATSPIYSWPEPDNTDLVKNGALAIRTLGNAIDTTMGTMVAKTIIDAKGDLIAGSAADTALRLAVGNNGETLVADSSTSTGLRYTAGTVQSNPILNSSFQVWQRGTSPTWTANNTTNYQADRWLGFSVAADRTVTRQATNDTTNLPNIQFCARVQRTAGNTATDGIQLWQIMESINSIPFAGKTVTMSFYARAGANFSATSNQLTGFLYSGTGTDQNPVFPGYTGQATVASGTATLTTTWQRFSVSGTVASTATELSLQIAYNPIGTAGANDYFEVTGVQLDIGSVALPFRTYAGTIQGELAACQRYYVRYDGTDDVISNGAIFSTTKAYSVLQYPVEMRSAPTLSASVAGAFNIFSNGGQAASTANVFAEISTKTARWEITSSGLTSGYACWLQFNSSGKFLEISAEL